MRIFVNLFLLLFFADSTISVLDEVLSFFAPVVPLTYLRDLIAEVVVLMSLPLYICLGIDRRLPKMILLPMIAFIFGCMSFAWILPSLAGEEGFQLLLSFIQLGLSLVIMLHLQKSGELLTITERGTHSSFFSLRNTLGFMTINLLLAPLVLGLLIFGSARSFIEENARGFMRLAPDGLHMTEKIYSRGDKSIRLAAMIHVGEKQYYDELTQSFSSGRTVILAEGVTDEKKLMREGLDYGRVAGFLGLTTQNRLQFKGRVITTGQMEQSIADEEIGAVGNVADILRADVDISSFRPETIRFLSALASHLRQNSSTVQGLWLLNDWSRENVTPELHNIVMDDIVHRRNKELIRYLHQAADRYDCVIVPWGALHLPEIEQEVMKEGFQLREQRERLSIDLKKLLKGMLI